MMRRAIVLFAAIAMLLTAVSAFALATYEEDFEMMDPMNTAALADGGWLIYANVFGSDWSYWYGYGVFTAPNDGAAFCALVTGEGGPSQGMNQLVTFSDYNNADHGNGAILETLVFQEQTIAAADLGTDWIFYFDAKLGNLEGTSTAAAYIKVLNPMTGYSQTLYLTEDMTTTPTTWSSYQIPVTIDAGWEGQLLQFGFVTYATGYQGSGVFYDNLHFVPSGTVATDEMTLDGVKSLFR